MNENKFNLTQYLLENYKDKNKFVYHGPNENYTIKDLEKYIEMYAEQLVHCALLPGDRIIITLNDGIQLIALFLSAIAIGACPIVLNPQIKASSLNYVINNSGARMLFKHDENNIKDICLVVNNIEYKSINLNSDVQRKKIKYYHSSINALSFIQYTSGTTGHPKGVMHSAANVLNACMLFAEKHLGIKAEDIIYSTSKVYFGYGMGNSIFFPLYIGASAIIDSKWAKIENVIDNLEKYHPTVLFSVPAVYSELIDKIKVEQISAVRIFFSAGSELQADLVKAWYAKFNKHIYNGIGCTELLHVFATNYQQANLAHALGVPVLGYEIKLLDHHKNIVLDDRRGELFVRGPSLFLGYWNDKAATDDKMNDGWYCTNDLCRYDINKQLYYEGRSNDLFKVNGRWVNPSLVETFVKNKFKQLSNVFLLPKAIKSDQSCTFMVYTMNRNLNDDSNLPKLIIAEIASSFDKYIVPIECKAIDSTDIPLNSNGKILRQKLIQKLNIILREGNNCGLQ